MTSLGRLTLTSIILSPPSSPVQIPPLIDTEIASEGDKTPNPAEEAPEWIVLHRSSSEKAPSPAVSQQPSGSKSPPSLVMVEHERPQPKPPPQKRPLVQAQLFTPEQNKLDVEFLKTIRYLISGRGLMTEIHQKAASALQERGFRIHRVAEALQEELIKQQPLSLHLSEGQPLSGTVRRLVTSIYFTECRSLTEFPPLIPVFGRLTTLHFKQTSLSSLPAALGECTSLTELQIVHHQLTEIPSQMGLLTNLTLLTLKDGLLQEVPPELMYCTYLLSLDLSKNRIKTLPLRIEALFRLTTLNLNFNDFRTWPPFWRLRNLTKLVLSRNYLPEVPATIRNMVTLVEIHLQWCGIQQITPYITELTRLKTLDISFNELRTLPPIGKCPSLLHLNVAYNHLTELPPLRNLVLLEISGNPLIPVNPRCQVVWKQYSEQELRASGED
ncbi:MAG: leucine-rich repeat domain-containing protein [Verrucomicrobia bacterium]|nr:leucine-rich repeat domain-containing protein [Verrucomicrobiota bacterium]